jgi:hypothetical protein
MAPGALRSRGATFPDGEQHPAERFAGSATVAAGVVPTDDRSNWLVTD